MQPRFDKDFFDEAAPNHEAQAEREYYGFIQVRRDLQLKSKAEKS
jgi:hypothetical protein